MGNPISPPLAEADNTYLPRLINNGNRTEWRPI